MSTKHFLSGLVGFVTGVASGNQMCKNSMRRLQNNERLKINVPSSTDEIKERVPKAVSAAAKELVDQQVVEITTGKIKE